MSVSAVPLLSYTLTEIEADPAGVLRKVQEAAPILTSEGWGHAGLVGNRDPSKARAEMAEPWFLEQFVRAAVWLNHVPAQKTINRRASSYGWKHVAEAWHERRNAPRGGYISLSASGSRDGSPELARAMGAVARELLGEPNERLSSKTELRFGTNGSVSVDLIRGIWHDHEAGQGGGVLDLLRVRRGLVNGAGLA